MGIAAADGGDSLDAQGGHIDVAQTDIRPG
jgi:hypothetical protein